MTHISVIIPCYNAAGYIANCLEKLEQQSYQEFEVVIIDDCSSDNTINVVRTFAEKSRLQIKLISNEKNLGPGASRNRGIQSSKAEYVCFCDSDDWYDPDYLELMVAASRNGEADMILCNSCKVTKKGKTEIRLFSGMSSSASAKQVLSLGLDSLCNLMVRRSIAAEVPQPKLYNGEDMAVIPLMIMRCSAFGFVEKCIYNYFCRSGSLSLSAHVGMIDVLERSFQYIIDHQQPGFEKEIEYIGMKNLVYGGLLSYFKAGKDSVPAKLMLERFEEKYPNWYSNLYKGNLPLFKKVFLFFAKLRWFKPLRLMCYVHRALTER